MTGKASLLLILGFSTIFLVLGNNFTSLTTRGTDNMLGYYNETVAHNIAVSGANFAAHEIYTDFNWTAGIPTKSFSGGTFNVSVQILDTTNNIKRVTSVGTYNGITKEGSYKNFTKKVELTFAPSKFSKFAYLSINDPGNLYWASTDTIWGPFHSQGIINAYQHPVFWGKATTNTGVHYYQNASNDAPKFYGGYEAGVDIQMPPDGVTKVQDAAAAGGYVFQQSDYTSAKTVYLNFVGDSIKYKFSSGGTETTVLAKDFAPNGVIFAPNATVKLKGVVKGQYTIGVSGSGGTKGSVILEDDVVYNDNPRTNPNSTDMLGIVAKNNVLIEQNAANNNDINIDASVYCETGGFGAGWSTWPISTGKINLYGGIQNYSRVQIGVFGGQGYSRAYKYDNRLLKTFPPAYPGTGKFEIVAWYEN